MASHACGEGVECGAEGGDLIGEAVRVPLVAARWRFSSMMPRSMASR